MVPEDEVNQIFRKVLKGTDIAMLDFDVLLKKNPFHELVATKSIDLRYHG